MLARTRSEDDLIAALTPQAGHARNAFSLSINLAIFGGIMGYGIFYAITSSDSYLDLVGAAGSAAVFGIFGYMSTDADMRMRQEAARQRNLNHDVRQPRINEVLNNCARGAPAA